MAQRNAKLHERARAAVGITPRSAFNGHPTNVTPAVKRFIRRGVRAGLVVTATTDGRHAPGSFHYQRWHNRGRGADMAAAMTRVGIAKMKKFYQREYRREKAHSGVQYMELFGPGRHYVKNGQRRPGQFPGHDNHVHGAPAGYG